MTRQALHRTLFDPAFRLLPPQMDSRPARALLEAIGLQESGLVNRRQIGSYRRDGSPVLGPARGLWQFEEQGATAEVMAHHASRSTAADVLDARGYGAPPLREIHRAFERDDVLACCFARLLLWTDPRLLPQGPDAAADGWLIYLRNWRPGKPKPSTWTRHCQAAWTPLEPETV